MARIVLGWELGGNSGHARRLTALAAPLLAAGHEVHLAVQRPDAFRDLAAGKGARVTLWQAPVWGGQWRYGGTPLLGEPRRFGDLLCNLGLQGAAALEGVLRGWDAILTAARPDLVIADFAPGLLLAARGRAPRVAVGTGFTVPPAGAAHFPAFPGEDRPPLVAEEAVLAVVNHALRGLGQPPLAALTEVMRAEAAFPAVFTELDPYAPHRTAPPVPPFIADPGPADGPMDMAPRVFAYLPAADLREAGLALLAELAALVPVHAVMPGLDTARRAPLEAAGIVVTDRPLPWADIRAGHTLILCNGGMGMVSGALVAGMPLAVVPGGIEQRLTARALVAHGLVAPQGAEPARQIAALAGDAAAAAEARHRAAAFRARCGDPVAAILQGALALTQ